MSEASSSTMSGDRNHPETDGGRGPETTPFSVARHHRSFFLLQQKIAALPDDPKKLADYEEAVEAAIDEQDNILHACAKTPARNLAEVMMKLSLWAADAPDLHAPEMLARHDAVALSAFADLRRLLGDIDAAPSGRKSPAKPNEEQKDEVA